MSDDKNKNPLEDVKSHKEVDDVTGIETTGHSWDGLRELNNPLPRWWVWVFVVCILWSIWYFVIYPAWPIPGGATEGTSGYTQYKELQKSQSEIDARQDAYLSRFKDASFDEIMNDPALYAFAIAGGAAAFKDNCATCHGTGAQGGKGYPNLNDDDWLWGGKLDQIHQTLMYGIRADNLDTRLSIMPAFGAEGLLTRKEIDEVVEYVLSLSNKKETAETYAHGAEIFKNNCASCHGADAQGDPEFGAPDLTDKIWLYGGDHKTVYETVFYARAGMMPAWGTRLDPQTLRQLAIYVHELGGGEDDTDMPDGMDEETKERLETEEVNGNLDRQSPEYKKTQSPDTVPGEEPDAIEDEKSEKRAMEEGDVNDRKEFSGTGEAEEE